MPDEHQHGLASHLAQSSLVSKIGRHAMTGPPEFGQFDRRLVVIGGCGHVGLPLAIAFADRGARVGIYDVSTSSVEMVNAGVLPFAEPGADEVLRRVVADGLLEASTDPAIVGSAEHVVVVIGTPVDKHLNPDQAAIPNALGGCTGYLRDGQLLMNMLRLGVRV